MLGIGKKTNVELLNFEKITLTTSRNLADTDNGMLLVYSGTTDIILTAQTGLEKHFSCVVLQQSTGKIKIAAGAGVTFSGLAYWTCIQDGSLSIDYTTTDTYSVNPLSNGYYISEVARTYAAQFVTEFASAWAGPGTINGVDVVVTTTAALNTQINNCIQLAQGKLGLHNRIKISASFVETISTVIAFNGTATDGDFLRYGGSLTIEPETTRVDIHSLFQINGIRGLKVRGLSFVRTATDHGLNKNWVPADGGGNPQDTGLFIVQRNSTRPLWPVVHFDDCWFGAGHITADPLEWATATQLQNYEELVLTNCSYKGGKLLNKLVNGRRFKSISPDYQLNIGDVFTCTTLDSPIQFGTVTGDISTGIADIANPVFNANVLNCYPAGITAGMHLSAAGIPAGTTVLSFAGSATAPTSITMSANATATTVGLSIQLQDSIRSRYPSDKNTYVWEIGGTRRNYFDGANTLSGDLRDKQYWNLHSDMLQLGTVVETVGFKELVENSFGYGERITFHDDTTVGSPTVNQRLDANSQGFFNDDDNSQSIDSLIVNAAYAGSSTWGMKSWSGNSYVENSTIVRVGELCPSAKVANGDAFNWTIDFPPSIMGTKYAGTGIPSTLTVRNSIAAQISSASGSGYAAVTPDKFANVIANPTIGTANYGDVFSGAFTVDGEGRNRYIFNDDGTDTQAQFRARWYAQFKTKDAATGRGVADPAKLNYTASNF